MAAKSAMMGLRGNQEPLAVLYGEDLRPLAHQVMITPALTAPVARLATTALALDSTAPVARLATTALALDSIALMVQLAIMALALDSTALVAPLVAAAMVIPAVPDTTTPTLLPGRNLGSCKAMLNS